MIKVCFLSVPAPGHSARCSHCVILNSRDDPMNEALLLPLLTREETEAHRRADLLNWGMGGAGFEPHLAGCLPHFLSIGFWGISFLVS